MIFCSSLSLIACVGVIFEDGGLCLFDPQAHMSVSTIKYVHSAS